MKKLLALVSGAFAFLPSALAVKPKTAVMRHATIISPPYGFPNRLDWDLNDPESVAKAKVTLEKLQDLGRGSSLRTMGFFRQDEDGTLGKKLKSPDTTTDMTVLPEVYGG